MTAIVTDRLKRRNKHFSFHLSSSNILFAIITPIGPKGVGLENIAIVPSSEMIIEAEIAGLCRIVANGHCFIGIIYS